MALTLEQIQENDRRFLTDFHSTGVWTHEYAAIALHHEALRLPDDTLLDPSDKPRVQMVIVAKIFAEAVASMETLGKLLQAIRARHPDGIAYRYVNGTEHDSERGLRLFRRPPTDLLQVLRLPALPEVEAVLPEPGGVQQTIEAMSEHIQEVYAAYLEPRPDGSEAKSIVRAYRHIKHGSCLVTDPRTVAIWSAQPSPEDVHILTRWPNAQESNEHLELKSVSMREPDVLQNIGICKLASVVGSNLCQLAVKLIDAGLLSYAPEGPNAGP